MTNQEHQLATARLLSIESLYSTERGATEAEHEEAERLCRPLQEDRNHQPPTLLTPR